ncbi:MAG: chorismate synthase [Clostridia bacterium]|nr:chorismate synthase [Clostridia bacterium]
MKNSFGNSLTVTLFGESHGPAVGAVLDGLCPGLAVDEAYLERQLARRRPAGETDTARTEPDRFQIISGVFNGKTTGTPLCIVIPNENARSGDYEYGKARPSHADYAAFAKYHGCEDYRGGGHFSGRVTAALVAAGAVVRPALAGLGVRLGTHILQCGGVDDAPFNENEIEYELTQLEQAVFPVLSEEAGRLMRERIAAAKAEGDSVGGATQTAVTGLPAGLGEPWFDSVEGLLSHALFSVGGVKGVAFGAGFAGTDLRGSEYNDALRMENGAVKTLTNRNGGVNGGITNGMPVVFRCAVKPTPSIAKTQQTVDFINNENTDIEIKGRHDPAILRRVCPVIDSVTALVLYDLIAGRYGTDCFVKGIVP